MQQNWVHIVLIIAAVNWLILAQTGEDIVHKTRILEAQANIVHSVIGLIGMYAAWQHFSSGGGAGDWVQVVLIISAINWLVIGQTGRDVVDRFPGEQTVAIHTVIGLVGVYAAWQHFSGAKQ